MFSLCIAGSFWIYSVHPPSYDPTNEQNYCNKTLYLFAFWLNAVCYGCLAVLLLCSGCLALYICVQNTCRRPQSSASNSQQQAWDFLECMSLYLADSLFKSTYRALHFINMLPENWLYISYFLPEKDTGKHLFRVNWFDIICIVLYFHLVQDLKVLYSITK